MTFPGSPRLLNGALVGLDPKKPVSSVIPFQYNPETLTRRLDARTTGAGEREGRTEPLRRTGPPVETITLAVFLDATDGLEEGDPLATTAGIYPALSALEMLLYPSVADVTANAALAQAGNIEIIPPEAPMTLFVWGPRRVLPVRLTGMAITEEAHDPQLNPQRARVDLTLRVLSYYDLKPQHPGSTIFLAHQIAKEVMANANLGVAARNLGVSLGVV